MIQHKGERSEDPPDKVVVRFEECPKFQKHELTRDQILEIAKEAVILAKNEFAKDLGYSVIDKIAWIVGLSVAALFTYLVKIGKIEL